MGLATMSQQLTGEVETVFVPEEINLGEIKSPPSNSWKRIVDKVFLAGPTG